MAKLVILEIGQGSFEQGFPVKLRISEDGAAATLEQNGHLPPAPEMPLYYDRWQAHYKELDQIYRLSAVASPPPTNVSRQQVAKKCDDLAAILRARLNAWIRTAAFEEIRTTWLKEINSDDVVRAIVQVRDREMQQLPWHLLDMVQGYTQLEIAVGASFEKPFTKPIVHTTVNILAILGDSRGINTKADAALLNQLPNTEVEFLAEPKRSQLTDRLWEKPWDILFFAGHSASKENYESGVIYLNADDKLTVSELKFALRKAVEKGLKLAIFNSCDGLGLARELADLHIPQVIVMREPVPDRVAQAFLKYFLQAYAQGEPLYLAVRQARERLEGMEDEFPCATWLPMIFQNLAELPPTLWPPQPLLPPAPPLSPPLFLRLPHVLLTSLAVAGLIAGVRHFGFFQPLELKAFDHAMQVRSVLQPEAWDDRILVIGIDNESLKEEERNHKTLGDKSISDDSLIKLLNILQQGKPAAIGMDLQRDAKGVAPRVVKALQAASTAPQGKLVGTCLGTYGNQPGFPPPAGITADQVGFADTPIDADQIIRRHLLFRTAESGASCSTPYSLSLKLALQYLSAYTIKESYDPDLVLGRTSFTALHGLPGGYQRDQRFSHALGGSQVLLNYRTYWPKPIPLSDVFRGRLKPDQIRDRLILIGVTHSESSDFFWTPQGRMAGVLIQAQMTSQIISAALDKRPLLRIWQPWVEIVWIGSWAMLGGLLIWRFQASLPRCLIGIGGAMILLYAGSLIIFTQAYWVPLIPAGLGLGLSSGGLALYQVWIASTQTIRRSNVPSAV